MATPRLENYVRQSIYDSLAALFICPEAPGTTDRWSAALKMGAALAGELGIDAKPLEALLEEPAPDAADIAAEFERVFGSDSGPSVPLLERAWRGASPEARAECRMEYLMAGVSLTDELGLPEDHLGMILGFTSVLLLREDGAAAQLFFHRHPARWLPDFARAVKAHPDADFYAKAATLLETLCEAEASLREANIC